MYTNIKGKYEGLSGVSQGALGLFDKHGIKVNVTSGLRPNAKTSSGKVSHHSAGNAFDITPGDGETWESLIQKIKDSPEIIDYFRGNKIGIYDERTAEVLAKTGGTGPHWHIGPDQVALSGFNTLIGGSSNSSPQTVAQNNTISDPYMLDQDQLPNAEMYGQLGQMYNQASSNNLDTLNEDSLIRQADLMAMENLRNATQSRNKEIAFFQDLILKAQVPFARRKKA